MSQAKQIRLMPLGRGGFGTVELVMRSVGDFSRLYAVKRLIPELANDYSASAMFLREAKVAGLMRHPNVVPVIEFGEDERGPFQIMDYVEGVPLQAILIHSAGRLLPTSVAVAIVRDAARGIQAVHQSKDLDGSPLNIVHRDVSPSNIMLGFDGVTRILDFGIARGELLGAQTDDGLVKGKIGYMSPEQLRAEPLDLRSDLFSLGVVLFEVLTSQRLYEPRSDPIERILREPPPDIADFRARAPAELTELTLALLAKERRFRPASALEVADQLDALLRELLAAPESQTVTAYLEQHFGQWRAEQQEKITSAVRGAQLRPDSATRVVFSGSEVTVSLSPQVVPPQRRPLLWLAIVVLMVASGIGALLLLGSPPDPQPVRTTEAARSSPRPVTPSMEPPTEADAAIDPQPPKVKKRRRRRPVKRRAKRKEKRPPTTDQGWLEW